MNTALEIRLAAAMPAHAAHAQASCKSEIEAPSTAARGVLFFKKSARAALESKYQSRQNHKKGQATVFGGACRCS
jgi:hypothetical protein